MGTGGPVNGDTGASGRERQGASRRFSDSGIERGATNPRLALAAHNVAAGYPKLRHAPSLGIRRIIFMRAFFLDYSKRWPSKHGPVNDGPASDSPTFNG